MSATQRMSVEKASSAPMAVETIHISATAQICGVELAGIVSLETAMQAPSLISVRKTSASTGSEKTCGCAISGCGA